MIIEQINIFRYSLPFKKPIVLKGERLSHREGLLIRLTDQAGNAGFGEIAPLPCFSRETISDAIAQLRAVDQQLRKIDIVAIRLSDLQTLPILPETKLFPSVRFGLEMAVIEMAEYARDAEQQESEASSVRVPVNGLIVALEDITPMETTDLIQNGYRTFKVKVGRTDIDSEFKQLERIAKTLTTDCCLRLDANQAWEFDEALDFCQRIGGLPVEYIEEPLTNPERLGELADSQSIPIALDETLVELDKRFLHSLIGNPGIKALVLKPTLLGGISNTLELARMGQAHGMRAVMSSSYESSVGINCLTWLARKIAPKTAHGLDTLSAFQGDLVNYPPMIENGFILAGHQADLSINMSQLTEVIDD